MTDRSHDDEAILIDLLLGECDETQAGQIADRLQRDESLRALHEDLRRTFAAMDLTVDHEPPEGLVAATLKRIRSAHQTDALLAREQIARRDVIRPTFSLREMGAIAGVVLLLASVFGVSYRDAQRRRSVARCAHQLARSGAGLLTYANKHNGYLPAAGVARGRWLPTASQPAVSNSTGLFKLVKYRYVEPTAFQCPAIGGEPFAVHAGMTDFPASKFVSYSYQYSLGPTGLWLEDPRLASVKRSMVILADSTPVFVGGRFRAERVRSPVSDNHDATGQNVLYLDMHVEFRPRSFAGVQGDNIYLAQGVYAYDGDEAPAGPTDTFLLPAFPEGNAADPPTEEPSPNE